jgi:hypothetical protein
MGAQTSSRRSLTVCWLAAMAGAKLAIIITRARTTPRRLRIVDSPCPYEAPVLNSRCPPRSALSFKGQVIEFFQGSYFGGGWRCDRRRMPVPHAIVSGDNSSLELVEPAGVRLVPRHPLERDCSKHFGHEGLFACRLRSMIDRRSAKGRLSPR